MATKVSYEEFSNIDLGDKRRDKRFLRVMDKLFESSEQSLSQSMGSWCEAKAAFRLFASEHLDEEKILSAHREQIKKRAEGSRELLFIQDTTSLNYTSHTQTEGLGSISQGYRGKLSRGLFCHTSYVLNESGLPLGIADQRYFSGKGGRGKSELTGNLCWVDALEQTQEAVPKNSKCAVIHVADREGDYWDFLSKIQSRKEFFVVRLIKQKGLKPILEEMFSDPWCEPIGEIPLKIEVSQKQPELSKYHRFRQTEDVQLRVTVSVMDLERTSYFKGPGRVKNLIVYLVRAVEKNPPAHREAIEWILKTNIEITSFEQAKRVIDIYAHRWRIELFHKILKSGCQVEKTRLAEAGRIQKYVTAMSMVAWRLHYMTHLNRHDPEVPCTKILSPFEWKALYCRINKTRKTPKNPPSINQAIRWIAQLGGFFGRKSDGHPGMITIWRGWNKLTDFFEFYEVFA